MVLFPLNDNEETKQKENEIAEYSMETTDASPSQLLIRIESCSLLSKHGIQQYESREFAAGDYTWRLIIYLNGDDISADLAMTGIGSLPMDWEVNAIFNIFLYNQILDNYVCFRGSRVCRFHAMKSKWGLSKFISEKSFTDLSNGYLVDDKCVFGAEVFVCKRQRVIECVSVLKPINPCKREWKISNLFKLKGAWAPESRARTKALEHKARASAKVLDSGTQSSISRTKALLPADDKEKDKKEDEKNEKPEFTMEIRDGSPSHLLIKIESFSIVWEHGIQRYESSEFSAGGYKWRLVIYPNDEYISANLAMVQTRSLPMNWEVNAIFNIFLYNQILDNYLCFRGKMRRFHAIKSEWGLSKFISKKSLTDPSKGYLVDDKCVFGAEVFVCERQRFIECVSVLNPVCPYERNWEISNFSKLERVWTSEEFAAGGHKWTIDLYPNGCGEEVGRSVSIFLRSTDSQRFGPHEKLKANFCLRIKNQLHDKHRSLRGSRWFTSSGCCFGWRAFISIADMRDSSKGFVVKNCCLLETEISVQVVAKNAA